jgi:secondary thiamine-phosphate synthase enzyme
MATRPLVTEDEPGHFHVVSRWLDLRTEARVQFADLTPWLSEQVGRSEVAEGIACVQVQHTTAGIVVNEAEPLLAGDLRRLLERLAPAGLGYAHDDLARRPEAPPDERLNGDAHCRAVLLGGSQTLPVAGGRLQLGQWQRVFLVELDGPRLRRVSLSVLGLAR